MSQPDRVVHAVIAGATSAVCGAVPTAGWGRLCQANSRVLTCPDCKRVLAQPEQRIDAAVALDAGRAG